MAAIAGSSSISSKNDKPVIVRVKRKAFQSRLDAFWLEINERPLKRPLLDFAKLSISDTSSSNVEELKIRKVLVHHVETVTSPKVSSDVLQSLVPSSTGASESDNKNKELRRTFRTEDKQDQLLAKAKLSQESLSKNARFLQIWRSRKEKREATHDEALHEMCRLYDVVRVDVEEKSIEVHQEDKTDAELEDHKMMSQYLPLLKEVLPSAAVEIESDIHEYMSRRASSDGFVYDIYAVKEDVNISEEDVASSFPLVQVDDDDDFYDGPDESEYETDDSNAENNPLNDYPDEEVSEDEDEVDSKSSDEQSETESRSSDDRSGEDESANRKPYEPENLGRHELSYDAEIFSDDAFDVDDDGEGYGNDYDYGDNYSGEEDWM